jgi:hypothetical protein
MKINNGMQSSFTSCPLGDGRKCKLNRAGMYRIDYCIVHILQDICLKKYVVNFAMKSGSCTTYSVPCYCRTMDEGTIKTSIPKCRLYWCFCLRWCSNFVGSASGQKQSGKLLQNMVYNTTQHHPTATHCLYIMYVYFGKGGGVVKVREKVEGQHFTRGVENTNMTDCISSL